MIKKILYILLAVFLIIQLFKPVKNIGEINGVNSIGKAYNVPQPIDAILKRACYDCHSNNTVYPWYVAIQPVAWWMASHVNEGKQELNFSEFATYKLKKQDRKLKEIVESQTDKWMPISSYTFAHKNARLTDEERKVLVDWANGLRKEIQSKI